MMKYLLSFLCLCTCLPVYGAEAAEEITAIPHPKWNTVAIEMKGNMYEENIYSRVIRIFNKGKDNNLVFDLRRMLEAPGSDHLLQYRLSIVIDQGTVKRNTADGLSIDACGKEMILMFNDDGELSLFDDGLPTASDVPPSLYVEWEDGSPPLTIDWRIGKSLGTSERDRFTSCKSKIPFIATRVTNVYGGTINVGEWNDNPLIKKDLSLEECERLQEMVSATFSVKGVLSPKAYERLEEMVAQILYTLDRD